VTTTPKPRPWLKALLADQRTRVSKASTYDNLDNLSPVFAEQIISQYEGTRLGRQELHAELLTDVEGALWDWGLIEENRIIEPPQDLERIVVAIDPAGTSKSSSDETGLIVAGNIGNTTYILQDRSGKYSPHGWAVAARNLYDDWAADAIIAETNYGGEMVEHTLRTSGVRARLVKVNARRSKALRAEPVVGLYEQGRVKHCGTFPELEEQMCEWVPFKSSSPDRLDALVYAVTNLTGRGRAELASPLRLVPGGLG
jgi:phage terminase large subunit-like protein